MASGTESQGQTGIVMERENQPLRSRFGEQKNYADSKDASADGPKYE